MKIGDLVSFSLYVDFLLAQGASRVSVVRAHHRPPFDAYEALKLGIVKVCSGEGAAGLLDAYAETTRATDPRRGAAVTSRVAALGAFLRRAKLVDPAACVAAWRPVPTGVLPLALGMSVNVNPELCLVLRGVPHVLKLYLRDEKLTRARVDMVTAILGDACAETAPTGAVYGVLDLTDATAAALHVAGSAKRLRSAATAARADGLSYVAIYRDQAAA